MERQRPLPVSGTELNYRDLLSFLDSHGTVERYILLATVIEVAIVDSHVKLTSVNTIVEEALLDAVCTSVTQTGVDGVSTGVVISPAGNDILLVGVRLHHLRNSLEHLAVHVGQARNVDGIVDGCKRSVVDNSLSLRTAQAVLELTFEIVDAGVGSLQTGLESVAVVEDLGIDNGNDGSAPVVLAEFISHAKVSRHDVLATRVAQAIIVTFVEVVTYVELQFPTVCESELVDHTCVE